MYAYFISPDPQGDQCLVYELASHGSLHNFLKDRSRRAKLDWTTRIGIALDVSKALEYLHGGLCGHTCFHRDVKSANVCLRRGDYSALLIDCGLSKIIPHDGSGAATMTVMESATGHRIWGTRGYICPRYVRRGGEYTSACDVFSLGVVLAEIFTGTLQNSKEDGEEVDMFDRYSGEGMNRGDLDRDADRCAGDWVETARDDFVRIALGCLSGIPSRRPKIENIVRCFKTLSSRARPRSPGERNHITVLSSAPLVCSSGGVLHRLSAPLNIAQERDLLVSCIRESGRDIGLTFDTATDDRLKAAATRRCGCLHFSGHGHREGLIFEDGAGGLHLVGKEMLYDSVHEEPFSFVFVSSCHSLLMGKALVEAGVKHVVCCEQDEELMDDAAVKFTHNFYFALAKGYTVKDAFEKGKAAVLMRFEQEESKKYVLLPESGEHDVPLFDAEELEWRDEVKLEGLIPPAPAPENVDGLEIDMYNLLQSILTHRLVNLVEEESSLALAVSHYINDRQSTISCVKSIYFLRRRKENVADASATYLKRLHEQLVKEGKANCLQDGNNTDSLVQSINDALCETKALIIFDGIESSDRTLLNVVPNMLEGAGTSRLLLTSRRPLYFSSSSYCAEKCTFTPKSLK